jgi:hypothetical protein
VEIVALGCVHLLVLSRSRIDPYFRLPMSDPLVRWRKVWFFLRNDADAPLPIVMGNHPIPQPKWGVQCGSRTHPHATAPAQCHPAAATRQIDGHGPPVDIGQPPHPTTPLMGDDHVDVSGAELF